MFINDNIVPNFITNKKYKGQYYRGQNNIFPNVVRYMHVGER